MEKYRDYQSRSTRAFGFSFLFSATEYHFTSFRNGLSAVGHFDPTQPTSLLYRKTSTLRTRCAMYNAKRATEEQTEPTRPLSERCGTCTQIFACRQRTRRKQPMDEVRTAGFISRKMAATAAAASFHASVFGWMVHVYPYEDAVDNFASPATDETSRF